MNERRRDFETLQRFSRQGDQAAFSDLVRQHIDLVYSTAVRKLVDRHASQEVTQNVFAALAKKAWQFAPDDSLPSWLHRTALLESQLWLRGELRRRRREQTAAELGTTMKTSDEQPAFQALVPLLDDALLSLREKDRTALLLRFYESQSLRAVGASLGVGEDAAQKRVQGALQKISRFFQRRGIKTASVAAATAALQQSAGASAATTSAVLGVVMTSAPPAVSGLTAVFARFASLSKLQTGALCGVLAVLPLVWQWEQTRTLAQQFDSTRTTRLAAQADLEAAAAEAKRLRADAARLETTVADAHAQESSVRTATTKLAAIKTRVRALMATDNYRWPDDLPFVRIPQSAVKAINAVPGPTLPKTVETKIHAFLNLTPTEQAAANELFTNYFTRIDQLREQQFYITNQASTLKLPSGAESTVFVSPPMGKAIRDSVEQLNADLAKLLGEERWELIKPNNAEILREEQVRLLGYSSWAWDQTVEIAVNLFPKKEGWPMVSWTGSGGSGSSAMPLAMFLNADQKTRDPGFPNFLGIHTGSPDFQKRILTWLAAEAARRKPTPKP